MLILFVGLLIGIAVIYNREQRDNEKRRLDFYGKKLVRCPHCLAGMEIDKDSKENLFCPYCYREFDSVKAKKINL